MKKLYIISIILLVLNCMAAARIGAALLTYRLSHSVPKTAATSTSATRRATDEGLMAFAPIAENGLFGRATQGQLTALATAAPITSGAAPEPTPAGLFLVGTARGSFRETFALIRSTTPPEERVFRLGDQVFNRGTLVSVQKESVEILSGGKRIKLLTPLATPAEPPQGASSQPAATTDGATQTTPGSFIIDQRLLNSALDNISQVMTDARLLPSVKDGKVEGFRVSEVKPSGIFAIIGIRNGDILHKINDLPVDSPERAIQSLASLKGQNRIKLDLVRDGQPSTFSYDIR